MAVLVTGATGLLGRRVVQQLLETNQEVRVMVRRPGSERALATPPTDLCYGDVSDPDALAEACRDATAVIHLVAVIRGGPQAVRRHQPAGRRQRRSRLPKRPARSNGSST